MATEALKQLVAREIASGETVAQVARNHGYSWKGMKGLVGSPEVRRLIARERQALDSLAEQHRAELVVLGATALHNIRTAVENHKHPKCLELSRFVVDKVVPQKQAVSAEVNIWGDARFQEEMSRALNAIKADQERIGRSLPPIAENPHMSRGLPRTVPNEAVPEGRGTKSAQ